MGAEGKVYDCSWRQAEAGFHAWLTRQPEVRASGPTRVAADEALGHAICMALGDGESVREYTPPLLFDPAAHAVLERDLVTLVGNTIAETATPVAGLFSGGICSACGIAIGERSDVPLELSYVEPGFDAGFLALRGRRVFLYSERFRERMDASEAARFRWLPTRGRVRRKFFECHAASSVVPYVAIAGESVAGWECPVCTWRDFVVVAHPAEIDRAVSAADLPEPLSSCFPAGSVTSAEVCCTRARWAELRSSRDHARNLSGIVPTPVGVVSPRVAVHRPALFDRIARAAETGVDPARRWWRAV